MCLWATISDWHGVLRVQPAKNWKQSILTDEGGDGLGKRLRTGAAVADVKKKRGTWRLIRHAKGRRVYQSWGMAVDFLACGGVPRLRRQAAAKCFGCDTATGRLWIGRRRRPVRPPRQRSRHGALKTPHCIGAEWLLMAPSQVSVRSLLETFFAVMRLEFCDGNLGLMWPDKCGAATNRRQIVGKRTVFDTTFGVITKENW